MILYDTIVAFLICERRLSDRCIERLLKKERIEKDRRGKKTSEGACESTDIDGCDERTYLLQYPFRDVSRPLRAHLVEYLYVSPILTFKAYYHDHRAAYFLRKYGIGHAQCSCIERSRRRRRKSVRRTISNPMHGFKFVKMCRT